MPITSKIVGGTSRRSVSVTKEEEMCTIDASYPAPLGPKFTIPYRSYLLNSGSNDMRVAGTLASPILFKISADLEKDVYLNSMSIVIADTGAKLNLFGALGALTNGVRISWNTAEHGSIDIHDGVKTNLSFMRLAGGNPSVGTGTEAFRADLSGGGADAYLPFIDFSDIFGFKWGLPLRAGTTDSFSFEIRDDLSTGIDEFDCIVYGIKV